MTSATLEYKYPVDPSVAWGRGVDEVQRALQLSLTRLLELNQLDIEIPVRETICPEELSEGLNLMIPDQPQELSDIIDHLEQIMVKTPTTSSRRFFNQLFSGRDPAGLAGDLFAAFGNQSIYTYKVAAPIVLIEEILIQKMGALAGFSNDGGRCGGIFTPGGSLSNLAAMLCARDQLNPKWRDQGSLRGRIYTSAESHYSVKKGAGIIGLGRDHVVSVPVNERGQLDPEALQAYIERDLAEGHQPMMVIATAGTTVRGTFDPFVEIADVCERYTLWFHIDGAFGGTALLSPVLADNMRGCERSDSLTWDAHKAMGVPLTCSVLLTKDAKACERSLSESASYLFQADSDLLNPGTRSLQCGRRNDALKLWGAWQFHGDQGWSRRLERQRNLALALAEEVNLRSRFKLCEPPPYLNVCFEVLAEEGQNLIDHEELCYQLQLSQEALVGYASFSGAQTKNETVIRAAVINPECTLEDIKRLLDSIEKLAAQV